MTVFGTRPEIIRLSRVIPLLDQFAAHTLVHTGQNFDAALSDVFFSELRLREPDVHLGAHRPAFGEQAGAILEHVDRLLAERQPERLVILGDTDSGLSAIAAARRGIPVFHLEAGNRCYDPRVPEEINRRIIDHCSTVLMPYTTRSMENLLREGIPRQRIFVTGNPIFEVLEYYRGEIDACDVFERVGTRRGEYFLCTLHRAENVDEPGRLARLFDGLARVASDFWLPVLVSLHPRTRERMTRHGIAAPAGVRLLSPMGLFPFVALEKSAKAVLTDSGTVQEECSIFRIPNVTLRDTSERMETVECGSNVLAGSDPAEIARATALVCTLAPQWDPPAEYQVKHVSDTIARVVLGPVHHALPT
jgi:UDP-N-acetylglucosamine 2-epimerase (non-hydrolysing)